MALLPAPSALIAWEQVHYAQARDYLARACRVDAPAPFADCLQHHLFPADRDAFHRESLVLYECAVRRRERDQ